MGDSLQDQLRALGLAQSRAAKEEGKKQLTRKKRQSRTDKKTKGGSELTLDQAYALRDREEKRQAQRARQKKQEEDRRRRELNNAIRDIVNAGRQNREDAEIPRNFMYKGRIRKLHVTAEQQRALNSSELGIVYLSGGYHLLDSAAVSAVEKISAEHVVDLGLSADHEDPEHPVPDDLIW
jgi:uncharacterized protein YaiL (DUF2058 family)